MTTTGGAETAAERKARERLERIERSRRALAEAYAADPAAVERFNQRVARLTTAKKRERERFEHLVLGKPRPAPAELVKPKGMSRQEWKVERKRLVAAGAELDPEIERAVQLRERWSHKTNATPETLEAAGLHHDALIQLERNGTIDKEQAAWAAEIANVHRSIEADVAVKVASFEARVDQSHGRGQVAEGVYRVRMHLAYRFWRELLPAPKQMVLDMIVGDAIGYTVAARRYRVHNRKAKKRLVEALNRWPACVAKAFDIVDREVVECLNLAISAGIDPEDLRAPIARPAVPAPVDKPVWIGVDLSTKPDMTVTTPVAAEFLDDRGYLRPFEEIAQAIRERHCG